MACVIKVPDNEQEIIRYKLETSFFTKNFENQNSRRMLNDTTKYSQS